MRFEALEEDELGYFGIQTGGLNELGKLLVNLA